MTQYQVQPLDRVRLDAAAAYLARRSGTDSRALVEELEWRLFRNPATTPGLELGQLLVGGSGEIAGVNVAVPQQFQHDGRSLVGLCSSAFYVDDGARLQGFLMFRRFLATPGADFVFATTCNAVSAGLWERMGALPVPDSRQELIVPLHPRPIIESRLRGHPARGMAAVAGRLAGGLLAAARAASAGSVRLTPAADLAEAAARVTAVTNAGVLTASRTEAFLRWRYAGGPGTHRLWLAEDAKGRKGWIAVSRIERALIPGVRSWMVSDLVWPREGRRSVLMAAAGLVQDEGDVLAVRGADALEAGAPLGWRRSFPQVPVWAYSRQERLSAAGIHMVPADGDTVP